MGFDEVELNSVVLLSGQLHFINASPAPRLRQAGARPVTASESLRPNIKIDIYVYQKIIKLLFYTTYITRPNTAKVLSKLLKFLYNPLPLYNCEVTGSAPPSHGTNPKR